MSYDDFSSMIDIKTSDSEKETDEIKKTVEKNKNIESFIILMKVSNSLKSDSLIYKIDDSYIRFDKSKKNFSNEISERLHFDFENERLEKIYSGNVDIKINIFMYILSDLEFSTLEENQNLSSLEIGEFINDFEIRKSKEILNKINNLINGYRQDYFTKLVEEKKSNKQLYFLLDNDER